MRRFARGRTTKRIPGQMNKTEQRYAAMLQTKMAAGEILNYWFEGASFKLAEGARYTPDFIVQNTDGVLEIHEIKGFMEEAAGVRINVFADRWPFRVFVIREKPKRDGGGWEIKEVGPKA